MFFRNNMPDVGKLLARAEATRGAAAYCCQCSWHTVNPSGNSTGGGPMSVGAASANLRWSCAGHSLK
jgi:hypothetical protein